MRLIVTGSRNWRGAASVWTPLDALLGRHGQLTVLNGKASRGLDQLVSEWAAERREDGVTEIPFEADWDRYRNRAGPIRNQAMVDAGADMLLAWASPCRKGDPWCPPGVHPSHGTADCVKKAQVAQIPVHFCPRGLSW